MLWDYLSLKAPQNVMSQIDKQMNSHMPDYSFVPGDILPI